MVIQKNHEIAKNPLTLQYSHATKKSDFPVMRVVVKGVPGGGYVEQS